MNRVESEQLTQKEAMERSAQLMIGLIHSTDPEVQKRLKEAEEQMVRCQEAFKEQMVVLGEKLARRGKTRKYKKSGTETWDVSSVQPANVREKMYGAAAIDMASETKVTNGESRMVRIKYQNSMKVHVAFPVEDGYLLRDEKFNGDEGKRLTYKKAVREIIKRDAEEEKWARARRNEWYQANS